VAFKSAGFFKTGRYASCCDLQSAGFDFIFSGIRCRTGIMHQMMPGIAMIFQDGTARAASMDIAIGLQRLEAEARSGAAGLNR
jgi:hypothetical protein